MCCALIRFHIHAGYVEKDFSLLPTKGKQNILENNVTIRWKGTSKQMSNLNGWVAGLKKCCDW